MRYDEELEIELQPIKTLNEIIQDYAESLQQTCITCKQKKETPYIMVHEVNRNIKKIIELTYIINDKLVMIEEDGK